MCSVYGCENGAALTWINLLHCVSKYEVFLFMPSQCKDLILCLVRRIYLFLNTEFYTQNNHILKSFITPTFSLIKNMIFFCLSIQYVHLLSHMD